jgi:sugar-specific transcriptional regulator TrmB
MNAPTALTAARKKEIAEVLSRFGLDAKQQAVYLALLPMGTTTLRPLAQTAGLQLTTAQSVVARLAESGLINVTKRGGRSAYEARDPDALIHLLEQQLEEVSGIIPTLRKLKSAESAPAALRVFWRERRTDVFHEALTAKDKTLLEIVAARDAQDILGEKFHFTRRRVAAKVQLRSLRVESQEIKKYSRAAHARELREAKFLPRELNFRCSVLIWDDTVAFFTAEREKLAWTVRSASLAEMYRQLFAVLWDISRKMETATE